MTLDNLIWPIASLISVVAGITIHEFSHAFSAELLGDPTPRYNGRLTLNPLAHLDPLGGIMILMSALSGLGFGWGKPVPVNPVNLRFGPRVGLAITAFAGPFSNLVLATLAAAPIRIALVLGSPLPYTLSVILALVALVNISLAVFNMLPLFPLDGFSVLRGLLSLIRANWAYQVGSFLDRFQAYGPIILLLLIGSGWIFRGTSLLGLILSPLTNLLSRVIIGF
ncbi:MAG: site-2 protease family protein [Anaerolineae bacterium]|nr:site-2 protease family protein [Anaerolineae bacterium]